MSATIQVSSCDNPYLAECLRLGILAARERPFDEDDWDTLTIERVCIPIMKELGECSASGESYVEIPTPSEASQKPKHVKPRGNYPFPDDCPNCDGKHPCPEHEHLAEPDYDSMREGK